MNQFNALISNFRLDFQNQLSLKPIFTESIKCSFAILLRLNPQISDISYSTIGGSWKNWK